MAPCASGGNLRTAQKGGTGRAAIELAEVLQQKDAISEILRAISNSPSECPVRAGHRCCGGCAAVRRGQRRDLPGGRRRGAACRQARGIPHMAGGALLAHQPCVCGRADHSRRRPRPRARSSSRRGGISARCRVCTAVRTQDHFRHAVAAGREGHRGHPDPPAGGPPADRQPDRAAQDLRRPGSHRDRERAALRGDPGKNPRGGGAGERAGRMERGARNPCGRARISAGAALQAGARAVAGE